MDDLLKILESFNRKERFFLVAQALGQMRGDGKPAFTLSPAFKEKLEEKVGVTVPEEPEKVFVAMDYHLNWVHASLVLSHPEKYGESPFRRDPDIVRPRDQEDVDLLVAFEEKSIFNLIFIEAKAYDDGKLAGYSRKEPSDQLSRKVRRLKLIFDSYGKDFSDVKPRLCLALGKEPEVRSVEHWPKWALEPDGKPNYLKLDLPSDRKRVQCCDGENRPSEKGNFFRCL